MPPKVYALRCKYKAKLEKIKTLQYYHIVICCMGKLNTLKYEVVMELFFNV